MHRRLAIFKAGTATSEALGILIDQLLDKSQIIEGHGRKDVVASSALEQHLDRGFVADTGSPSDDVALVQVANAVDVSAGVEEDSDALEISVRRSKMQRARVVSGVASIRIGPSFASFFRYSSDARSGRLRDTRHLPSKRARCPLSSGWKSGSLTVNEL
jgi:hypothetical protein